MQIKPTAHFANDLGLDSLDTVEVVMAIEEVWQPAPRDTELDCPAMKSDGGFWMLTCVQQHRSSALRSPTRTQMPSTPVSNHTPHPGYASPRRGHLSHGFCGRGQRNWLTRFSSHSRQGRRVHPEPTRCPLNHGAGLSFKTLDTQQNVLIQRRQTGRHQRTCATRSTPLRDGMLLDDGESERERASKQATGYAAAAAVEATQSCAGGFRGGCVWLSCVR